MKAVRLFTIAMFVAMGILSPVWAASGDTLIVMPVRYTVVQFAFDIARIRPTHLVAYDTGTGDEPLLLHTWDTATGGWKPADLAQYQAGTLFGSKPKRAFLIGSKTDLPAELADASGWCKDVTRVPSLKVMDMANAMSNPLDFSESEWNRLAKRHNLDLTDDNAERRRYGRYGKPGTRPTGPHPVNPLIARFRGNKTSDADQAEPLAPLEEEIQEEPAETPQLIAAPQPAPVEEKGVPMAIEEGPAILETAPAAEVDTPAEFK
ncbi:MAG: hypothetical protein HQ523_13090 [Lentisphaerae bacterium]|nr:hypothetical protein [Lentisphaerota bacterium]